MKTRCLVDGAECPQIRTFLSSLIKLDGMKQLFDFIFFSLTSNILLLSFKQQPYNLNMMQKSCGERTLHTLSKQPIYRKKQIIYKSISTIKTNETWFAHVF